LIEWALRAARLLQYGAVCGVAGAALFSAAMGASLSTLSERSSRRQFRQLLLVAVCVGLIGTAYRGDNSNAIARADAAMATLDPAGRKSLGAARARGGRGAGHTRSARLGLSIEGSASALRITVRNELALCNRHQEMP
jgi:hypothetical protein